MNWWYLSKHEASDTKQDKLHPGGKLLEQVLHKLPTTGVSWNPLYKPENMTSRKLKRYLLKRQEKQPKTS